MFEEKLDNIVNCLIDVVPKKWSNVILHGEFDETHYTFYYYAKVDDEYYQCFNMNNFGISRESVRKCFEKIYDVCKEFKKDWSSFDLSINKDGNFKIEYNYEHELSLDEWKNKFLV